MKIQNENIFNDFGIKENTTNKEVLKNNINEKNKNQINDKNKNLKKIIKRYEITEENKKKINITAYIKKKYYSKISILPSKLNKTIGETLELLIEEFEKNEEIDL